MKIENNKKIKCKCKKHTKELLKSNAILLLAPIVTLNQKSKKKKKKTEKKQLHKSVKIIDLP